MRGELQQEHSTPIYTSISGSTKRLPRISGVAAAKEPFIFACAQYDLTVRRPSCPLPGIAVETMEYLMRILQLDYELVQLNISGSDYGRPLDNGTWSGECMHLH